MERYLRWENIGLRRLCFWPRSKKRVCSIIAAVSFTKPCFPLSFFLSFHLLVAAKILAYFGFVTSKRAVQCFAAILLISQALLVVAAFRLMRCRSELSIG